MAKKLVLIDGHSILNRAFYGLPDLTNAQGQHTGGVYGFLTIMLKVLGEENGWYEVLITEKRGYVCGKYLNVAEVPP